LGRITRVAIALGSNLGDRASHLQYAVTRLSSILTSVKVSHWLETDPVGVGPQPNFLNGAVVGPTELSARELLERLLAIERERGRERPFAGAPRTLDLDLILFGDEVIDEPDLVVPHPRFRERRFVLEPLAEVAPDLVDPVTRRTVRELLSAVPIQ
jgi:2-amino-4-hydroxy-6-hydroxymethyldihydropteridine diphosphokinase